MNSREKMDGLMMLFRAMNGEKNIVEHMETEGQQEVIRNVMLAKDMSPCREEWEKIGFTFTDIEDDNVLCNATLPEGWIIQETSHSLLSDIIDSNGVKRGSMFYKAAFYDRKASMSLMCRYSICTEYLDEERSKKQIYFGNKNEKLFIAGQVCWPNKFSEKDRKRILKEEDNLRNLAIAFAEEYYPDWKSVSAYWEESPKVYKK